MKVSAINAAKIAICGAVISLISSAISLITQSSLPVFGWLGMTVMLWGVIMMLWVRHQQMFQRHHLRVLLIGVAGVSFLGSLMMCIAQLLSQVTRLLGWTA